MRAATIHSLVIPAKASQKMRAATIHSLVIPAKAGIHLL
jgi:hypothetical protein